MTDASRRSLARAQYGRCERYENFDGGSSERSFRSRFARVATIIDTTRAKSEGLTEVLCVLFARSSSRSSRMREETGLR